MDLRGTFPSGAVAGAILLPVACAFGAEPGRPARPAFAGPVELAQAPVPRARVSITGVRLTRGDGVRCPAIRDDDGRVHTVSYLSPDIPIGGRVTVRGYYAIRLSCFDEVLVVEEERARGRP
jgi:hypothetical protein